MFTKKIPACQLYSDERKDTYDRCQALIFDKTGDYILIVKESVPLEFKHLQRWGFPKGHFKIGETLIQCIHREVCEEVGIKINDYKHTFEIVGNNHIIRFKEHRNNIYLYLGPEIEDYTWININTLKKEVYIDISNKKNNPDYTYYFNAQLRGVITDKRII